MSQVSSVWRRLTCQALALSMVVLGLTVLATPPAHAAADAVVSGLISDSVTHLPLASVTVSDSTSGRSATTSVAGTYSLSVPAGDHVLTASFAGYVPSSTPKLTLVAGQTLGSQGFTLQKYASASGTVTEKGTSTGIAAVVVKFFDASTQSPNPEYAATTGPDGSWSLPRMAPGSFKVQFDARATAYAGAWLSGAASPTASTTVELSAGETRELAGALNPSTVSVSSSTSGSSAQTSQPKVSAQSLTGTISGRITVEPGGTPAPGAVVQAIRADGLSMQAVTAVNGAYSIPELPAGYYQVVAQSSAAPPYLQGYLGGAVSSALASYVWLADGTSLAGQDIALQREATLSGTVTDRGRPVEGAAVSLTGMGALVGTVRTGADGTFTVTRIPPGRYRLSASFEQRITYWNGSTDIGNATEITIASAASLSGYQVVLPEWYELSGKVYTSSDHSSVFPYSTVFFTDGIHRWTRLADGSGRYSISLPPGSYEAGLGQAGVPVWSPGSTTRDVIDLHADTVKDLTTPGYYPVGVQVNGSDGAALTATATVSNTHGETVAQKSDQGRIALTLPIGVYRVAMSSADHLPQSMLVTVSGPTEVSAVLDVGGRFDGNVSQLAEVAAINVATGERFSYWSSASYSIGGLPTGDYVLAAAPASSWLASCGKAAWFGGTSYLTARRLHVDSGSTIVGNDFTVSCDSNWPLGGEISGAVALPPSVPVGAVNEVVVQATSAVETVTTTPSPDGSFLLGDLLPGTYLVTAYQPTLGLEAQTTVTIEAGSGLDLVLNLVRKRRVTGQVVGPHGEPVIAVLHTGELEASTDPTGHFSLGGLAAGSHTLTIDPSLPYAPVAVDVTVGASSDIEGLVITARLAGKMSGLFSAPDSPAETRPVMVTVTDAQGHVVGSDQFWNSFAFTDLPPGPVKVRFSGFGIVEEWWRDAPNAGSATPIVVPEGGGVTDITPNLSHTTLGGAVTTISGTVTYGGSPLAGVNLTVRVGTSMTVPTTTAADGTYGLTVPLGGTYTVQAYACIGPSATPCAGQVFADARDVVATGSVVSGVDFAIPLPANSFSRAPQPVISGRPALGSTLTATVGAWEPTPDSTTWQWYADGLPIYQATGTTFTLTDGQVGKIVQVVVTGEKAGYTTITMPSAGIGPVEVPGGIQSLTPSRLLDSRIGLGFQGPAGNGTTITLPVWGRGGVPTGASAVLVNLTVTGPTASGFLTAWASGGVAPGVSNANFTTGATLANLSLVPVGPDGAIALRTSLPGSVHVIADVQGYVIGGTVSAQGAIVPVTPTRLLDTRTSQRVGPGASVTLQVAGVAGVPLGASAVVANLTVTGPGAAGFLTAYPTGVAKPNASNVNFVARQTVPNMAIVKVGDNQSLSIANSSSAAVDVVVDIQGYVTAGSATLPGTVKPITPTRVVDTRINQGATGPVPANSGRIVDFDSADLTDVPQGALINLTVTNPQASGWLAAYPYGVDRPGVSNLNFTAGAVVPNLSLVTLGDGYGVLFNGSAGTAQMVADVLAYVLS